METVRTHQLLLAPKLHILKIDAFEQIQRLSTLLDRFSLLLRGAVQEPRHLIPRVPATYRTKYQPHVRREHRIVNAPQGLDEIADLRPRFLAQLLDQVLGHGLAPLVFPGILRVAARCQRDLRRGVRRQVESDIPQLRTCTYHARHLRCDPDRTLPVALAERDRRHAERVRDDLLEDVGCGPECPSSRPCRDRYARGDGHGRPPAAKLSCPPSLLLSLVLVLAVCGLFERLVVQ